MPAVATERPHACPYTGDTSRVRADGTLAGDMDSYIRIEACTFFWVAIYIASDHRPPQIGSLSLLFIYIALLMLFIVTNLESNNVR